VNVLIINIREIGIDRARKRLSFDSDRAKDRYEPNGGMLSLKKLNHNLLNENEAVSMFVLCLMYSNSVAFSPQATYTDWATATCWRNLVPTFADRGVSRGQRGGSRTVVNLSFLDRSRYFSFQ
jgi:hypothetical protein